MNKKVIISLVLVALMGFGTAIGTYAYFTSTATSTANVFTAGTLTIAGPGANGIASGLLEVTNIYPGWEQSNTVTITNSGSLPFKYKVTATTTDYDKLWNGADGLQVSVNDGTFVDIDQFSNVLLGSIKAGGTQDVKFTFKLPTTANDDYQGLSNSINFVFDATQIENNEGVWAGTGMELVKTQDSAANNLRQDSSLPHIKYQINGNKVTLTFINPTKWTQWFDYRVDGEIGEDDQWSTYVPDEGELNGQQLGAYYNSTEVLPGKSVVITVNVAEEVWTGLRRGPEDNWRLDWIKFELQ
jgi:predicted ribosomally synthesized peptide with SipW-like signal peptide